MQKVESLVKYVLRVQRSQSAGVPMCYLPGSVAFLLLLLRPTAVEETLAVLLRALRC